MRYITLFLGKNKGPVIMDGHNGTLYENRQ